mmetsp:Transcript_40596/g.114865  ORF Transcript_40596/g.114865 Transcript_40596/m.114865 type:complete len:344 (-) Transcript_40596:17-1048(-)
MPICRSAAANGAPSTASFTPGTAFKAWARPLLTTELCSVEQGTSGGCPKAKTMWHVANMNFDFDESEWPLSVTLPGRSSAMSRTADVGRLAAPERNDAMLSPIAFACASSMRSASTRRMRSCTARTAPPWSPSICLYCPNMSSTDADEEECAACAGDCMHVDDGCTSSGTSSSPTWHSKRWKTVTSRRNRTAAHASFRACRRASNASAVSPVGWTRTSAEATPSITETGSWICTWAVEYPSPRESATCLTMVLPNSCRMVSWARPGAVHSFREMPAKRFSTALPPTMMGRYPPEACSQPSPESRPLTTEPQVAKRLASMRSSKPLLARRPRPGASVMICPLST